MERRIQMLSKSSLGVALPKQALELLGIKKGDPVEVELIESGFVIRVKKGVGQSGGTVFDNPPGGIGAKNNDNVIR